MVADSSSEGGAIPVLCQFRYSERGFTLIEIIGVLAIMSILAAVIAPSAIQMITSSKGTAEDSALTAISNALRLYVRTNKKIPDRTTWDTVLAKLMNTKAGKVSQNGNNLKRIYLYPDDFFATNTSLPYDQATAVAGGTEPVAALTDPRVMVISNLNSAVTLTQTSAKLTAAAFANIWNQTSQPAELTDGNLLNIARIDLSDLFKPITLQNYDTATTAPYHVDAAMGSISVAVNSTTPYVRTMYLIDTTLVGLYAASPNPDTLDTTYTMQASLTAPTYSYNTDVWSTSGNPGTNGSTGIGSVTNSSGVFNAWTPKANCTAAPAALVVDNKSGNQVADYGVFSGDASGNIVDRDRAKTGDITFFAGPGITAPGGYSINKTRNAAAFNTCDVVIVVPEGGQGAGVKVYIFYMPTTASNTAPYVITVP